jgi:hypothetical protein
VQPIVTDGEIGPLTVTGTSRLAVTYSTSPNPQISVNVNTSETVAGTFQESATIQAQSIPNCALTIPFDVTLQPAVSFSLAESEITIHYRHGQAQTPAQVGITTQFGNENFGFSVVSSAGWMFANVNQVSGLQPVLSITTEDQAPGTYTGTLTVSLQGLTKLAPYFRD